MAQGHSGRSSSGSQVQRPAALLPAPSFDQMKPQRGRGSGGLPSCLPVQTVALSTFLPLKKAAVGEVFGETAVQVEKIFLAQSCQPQVLKWSLGAWRIWEGQGAWPVQREATGE